MEETHLDSSWRFLEWRVDYTLWGVIQISPSEFLSLISYSQSSEKVVTRRLKAINLVWKLSDYKNVLLLCHSHFLGQPAYQWLVNVEAEGPSPHPRPIRSASQLKTSWLWSTLWGFNEAFRDGSSASPSAHSFLPSLCIEVDLKSIPF